ncbi:MAG: NAD(P)-dependent oxidoreductase, partial [Candidatus Accumulibacter sp.]|nr:NAD(P)-dependent oxidoreductase [Accumulibacter sp.]
MDQNQVDLDEFRGARVLVTGASGFIGAHLTRSLVAHGARVGVLLRPSGSLAKLQPLLEHIEVVRADLCDEQALEQAVARIRPRYAFHMAAFTNVDRDRGNDELALTVNLTGTVRLLNFLADNKVTRIVNSGSC